MRAFRLFLAIAIAAVILPATAAAQGWRQVYRDPGLNVSIDTTRITRAADGAYTVMMRWNYARPRLSEERHQYTRLIQQVQVRCTPTPVRVKRFGMALYNATGALVEEARPLTPAQIRMMDWERLPARSEGSRVYPAVCRTLSTQRRS
jgi:hypothetical protein